MIFDPSTNTWTAMTTTGAPSARYYTNAIWTGSKMIVWGGKPTTATASVTNTGGVYDPATNTWSTAPTTTNAPTARAYQCNQFINGKMYIWGGLGSSAYLNTGAYYQP